MTNTEIPVLEGLLCWDGRVLELFRNDGRQGGWRLHGSLVTAVHTEVRKDRLEVRFHTTPTHYESAQVAPEGEAALRDLVAAVGRA